MPSVLTQNPLGSLWHRWDPHLHAPGTLLNDQFAGDWDTYLAKLEQSSPRIEALGVTDYFCIRTYREVKARKEAGRLPDVEFIFPNVELRIETKTSADKAINVHLLFSPGDPKHENEIERILGLLTFDHNEKTYRCTRDDLIALGKAHEPSQSDEVAALRTGANQFKTTLKDLKGLFKSERWMRDNALVVIASKTTDGSAGLQEDSQFAAMRVDLERFADGVFSGREKDRLFWLGEGALSRIEVEEKYRGLKPCFNGSDAHQEGAVGQPSQDRFCWLKGDLTFETLRQCVVEPGDRITIGSQPPAFALPAFAIDEVCFGGAPWMKKSGLRLNPGLVAVIGPRGSGKTALADIVAKGGNAFDAGKGEASFLKRAAVPVDLLGAAEVTLKWGDGTDSARKLSPANRSSDPEEVRYLSQHFVERLCAASGLATELRAAMEQVVFESTDQTERMEADSFDELAHRLLEPVRAVYVDLQGQIEAIGDSVVQEEILQERLSTLQAQKAALIKKIDSTKKEQQKLIPKGAEENAKLLQQLEKACVAVQLRVENIRHRQKTLDDLEAAAKYITTVTEPTRFTAMRQKYAAAQLSDAQWEALRLRFAGDPAVVVVSARQLASQELKATVEANPGQLNAHLQLPYEQWPLIPLQTKRDAVKATVGIDAQRRKKYDDSQKQIVLDEIALKKIDQQVAHAAGASSRRAGHVTLRRQLYVQVFEQLIEEEKVLDSLYAPLKQRLANATGALSKLAFVTERTVDLARWSRRGEELFDLRSGDAFKGHGGIRRKAEQYLMSAWRTGLAEDVAKAMDAFRDDLQQELKNMPTWVNADERRAWFKAVSSWLYSTDHIKLRYGIEYDNVAIEQLSPGTRGVVLLLLYLAVDLQDQRPLIVDQPEENLDPNSVFNELVPHFREVRMRRQVIVVTHNANLVVNTDADQVIIASSVYGAGGGLPEIDYQTGSLENPAIRGAVCEILEGGERAFLERERRYRLRWGHNLLEEADTE